MVRRAVSVMRTEKPIRVYQWLAIWMAMTATWAVGIYGAAAYVSDQREEARRYAAAAQFSADLAQYQNARDERLRCEQGVDARSDLRGVLLGIFDAIDPESDSVIVAGLRTQLDRDYPMRILEDCPPVPDPPEPLSLD